MKLNAVATYRAVLINRRDRKLLVIFLFSFKFNLLIRINLKLLNIKK